MGSIRIGDTSSLEKQRRVNTSAGCYLVRKSDDGLKLLIIKKTWPSGDIKYVLPKGHKEGDETLEKAAIRETKEESGYTDFKLLRYLGSSTYELDWSEIQMKTDHYFLAVLNSDKQIERKPEEYEKDVVVENLWLEVEKALTHLKYENYKEITDLLKEYIKTELE
ncbi:MAG: NUDIX domain-containing protein [Candidatus Dojkabacteria bacterium]|jgi:8-oxo-dGTP pyrophosphatase MutT (NUDIX family)|nr:NUDIX domain-containing protein [Candidatus Dojkabacteria bacterium]